MNALGTSNRRVLTSAEKQAIRREAERHYTVHIENAKSCCYLFMMISLMQTLENEYNFGKKRREEFKKRFDKCLEDLNAFLESNTFTSGISEHQNFDIDYNHEKLRQLAEYYGIPFDESIFVF